MFLRMLESVWRLQYQNPNVVLDLEIQNGEPFSPLHQSYQRTGKQTTPFIVPFLLQQILHFFSSTSLNHIVVNSYLYNLITLTIAELTMPTKTNFRCQQLKLIRKSSVSSTFVSEIQIDKSNINFIGNVFGTRRNCTANLSAEAFISVCAACTSAESSSQYFLRKRNNHLLNLTCDQVFHVFDDKPKSEKDLKYMCCLSLYVFCNVLAIVIKNGESCYESFWRQSCCQLMNIPLNDQRAINKLNSADGTIRSVKRRVGSTKTENNLRCYQGISGNLNQPHPELRQNF